MSESTPAKAVIMKLHEQDETFEQILRSAIIVSWADLMRGRSGVIHIKYDFAPSGALDCVQVWSSIKWGYWLLACTYGMSASKFHDTGVHFDNGFKSEGLAQNLDVVMQHQNLFTLPENLGREGLLQIAAPTEKESNAAIASINDAVERVNSHAVPGLPAGL